MKNSLLVLITILTTLTCCSIHAYYFDSMSIAKFQGYNGDGNFVEYPAYAGSSFGYVLGILPAALCSEPQRLMDSDQASDKLGTNIIEGCAKTFGCGFGALPYGFKKVFWDFPVWVFGSSKNNNSYYDYKPLPQSVVQIDPRLLTPEEKVNMNVKTNIKEPSLVEIKQAAPVPPVNTPSSLAESPAPQPVPAINIPKTNSATPQIPTQNNNVPSTNTKSSPAQINTYEQQPQSSNNSQQWEAPQNLPDWVSEKASK